jgi:hypothetical protein
MCEQSPWSRGPLLRSVHGGLTTGIGRRARRRMARGCYGGRELAAGAPIERGGRGDLTVGEGGQHGAEQGRRRGAVAAVVETRRGRVEARRGEAESGTRCGGVLQC